MVKIILGTRRGDVQARVIALPESLNPSQPFITRIKRDRERGRAVEYGNKALLDLFDGYGRGKIREQDSVVKRTTVGEGDVRDGDGDTGKLEVDHTLGIETCVVHTL